MGGGGAESADIRTGSAGQANNLSSSFGEVAAAALVHITAGLLGAVDHIVHLIFVDAGSFDQVQQGEDAGSFGNQVFMDDMGGEVGVHIVSSLHIAHQFALMIQGLSVLVVDKVLNLAQLNTVFDLGDHVLGVQRMGFSLGFDSGDKGFLQVAQIKHVADLHQHQEFILGHDFTVFAIAVADRGLFVVPGLLIGSQLIGGHVADVGLVGHISEDFLVGTQMLGNLFQVLGIGVDNLFSGLGGAVLHHHIRGECQDITRAFNNTVHWLITSLF